MKKTECAKPRHACRRMCGPALLMACVVVTVPGCVGPPSRIDRTAEQRAASDPAALMRVAQAADRSGNPSTAAVFYRRAFDLDASNADAALGLAHALTVQGDADQATETLRTALARVAASDSVRVRKALGDLLVLSHRPTEAVAVFRAGLDRLPNEVPLLIGLGVAQDNCRDHAAAQAAYRKALTIEPGSIAGRNDLGLSIALAGDTDTALETLRQVRAEIVANGGEANDLATIDGNLALVYAMQGNLAGAARSARGAASDPTDLAANMKFYSALAPGSGASSGLPSTPEE